MAYMVCAAQHDHDGRERKVERKERWKKRGKWPNCPQRGREREREGGTGRGSWGKVNKNLKRNRY